MIDYRYGIATEEVAEVPEEKAAGEQKLARLEERYRNELMDEEQRLELKDQIGRLKRRLETATETVDAQHSGLERMGS